MKSFCLLFLFLLISQTEAAANFQRQEKATCPVGFTGKKCDKPICNSKNNENLSPDSQNLAFFVHDSVTTRQMIREMQGGMEQTIKNITTKHPNWITDYSLIKFDNQSMTQLIITSDANEFLHGFNDFAEKNSKNTTSNTCTNLAIYELIYIYLSGTLDIKNPNIFVFMNGIIRNDNPELVDEVNKLILLTGAKIHFIQTNPYPCGEEITSEGPQQMWNISRFSGGEVFVISPQNTANVMKGFIPTRYKSSLIAESYFQDCSSETKTTFFLVDSEITTVNIETVTNGNSNIRPPVGYYSSNNIFNDYYSNTNLYELYRHCVSEEVDGGICYDAFFIYKTWIEVKAICEEEYDEYLVSILSHENQDYFNRYTVNKPVWIGLNYIEEEGKFVWDQGNKKPSIPLSNFTNWDENEPNLENGKCVLNVNQKWQMRECDNATVTHLFVCMTDNPQIPQGKWTIQTKTSSGACSARVTAQSNFQIYREFVQDVHDDLGKSSPIEEKQNYMIVNLSNNNVTLNSVKFSSESGSFKLPLRLRDSESCKFEYISDGFHCQEQLYQTTFIGTDSNGNQFQRILPTYCSAQ